MAKNLLIVESPAKAKTIEKILGKDFKVKSSFGHIRDLPVSELGVDIENDFKPNYIISKDKTKVVKELKSEVKKVDDVWLATDEDREGEAISWHLSEVLGLDSKTVKRITFREITKPAVKKAIENPRNININLVNAQQSRRILDRLVGYELSQLLWRKIKGKLSAGRVQSVALKLIVEREREIRNFVPVSTFKVYAIFDVENDKGKIVQLKAELNKVFNGEKQAYDFLNKIKNSVFEISDIKVKPVKRNPAPPFTTSTLQQEASRRYGFGVKKTMMIAQRLYEKGLITYMRTDSTNISDVALGAITNFISSEYGEEYHQFRRYSSKKNAQEAHEAIRPSYIEKRNVSGDKDEQRLYELIWKRTIACQMSSAIMERTDVEISISDYDSAFFLATGQVVKFDGFLKVYMEAKDDEEDDEVKGMLPPLRKGQKLDKNIIEAVQKYTKAPARYTEATLVKKLEALGIGRPSTYAPTISKIMEKDRGYVVKERIEGKEREVLKLSLKGDEVLKKTEKEIYGAASNRLHPTDMGMIVIDFLEERFSTIMDYGFTAEVEKELDDIAEKGLDWHKIVADLYFPFHKEIENTYANATRVRAKRELGKDP
ncbi:MAG TPA: type I DNA topoisomerase, partial [Bacteroidetes bacterium]|nr:type I DNA topoisomerase [Bacteroidota bacterium]